MSWILDLIASWDGYGVFIGMILESSIVPIPSEIILVTAGLAGINPLIVGIAGGLGSTIGAAIGYFIGMKGRVFIDIFGKYFFVTNDRVSYAESWFRRWGNWTILISRLIPFIPYKIFSIAAGLLRMNSKAFLLLTLIGSVPRCFLLALLGTLIIEAEYTILIVLVLTLLLVTIAYYIISKHRRS